MRNGETGVLTAPCDIDGFADALEAYARDPELMHRHAEAGLAYARTQDWDEINGAVLRVYENLVERRRPA